MGHHEIGDFGGMDRIMAPHAMYACIPEMGIVDVWHKALASIEELKFDGKFLCEAVVGIAKFFDRVRRGLVYKMVVLA